MLAALVPLLDVEVEALQPVVLGHRYWPPNGTTGPSRRSVTVILAAGCTAEGSAPPRSRCRESRDACAPSRRPGDYTRWLGDEPYPAELMRMWPISTRVNKPENDDASIVEPIEAGAARGGVSEVHFWPKRTTSARDEFFWV